MTNTISVICRRALEKRSQWLFAFGAPEKECFWLVTGWGGVARHVAPGYVLDPLDSTNCHSGLQFGMQEMQEVRYCTLSADTEGKKYRFSDPNGRSPESYKEKPDSFEGHGIHWFVIIHRARRNHSEFLNLTMKTFPMLCPSIVKTNTEMFTHPMPSRRLSPGECHRRSR